MNLFENNVLKTIEKHKMIKKNDKVLVALSGGADSCALLLALKELSEILGISLSAAHLNHGIRGEEAERDLEFSKEISRKLKINFYSKTVDVPSYAMCKNISEEMAGRELRYAFFNELSMLHGFNKIAVAHNKNDSAETVLLNLIRGSGSQGLTGILPVNCNVIRPLIQTCRTDIESYLHDKDIHYMTDSTNIENIYSRNILRNKVFPKLCEINSNALSNIEKCSAIISDEHDFLCEYVKTLGITTLKNQNVCLDEQFDSQHIAVKRTLVLNAVRVLNGNTLNFFSSHLDSIISGCKTGSVIKLPCKITVIFEHDQIVFTKDEYIIDEYEYNVSLPGKLTVKETKLTYSFDFATELGTEANCQYINVDNRDLSKIILRTKRDGDFFIPSGMNGNKKIKKFFIDNKIPAHERNKYPLLVLNDEIASVLMLRVSEKYTVNKNTKKILKITVSGGKDE